MIESILQNLIQEIKDYRDADTTGMYLGATVLLDTDFTMDKIPSYTLPLIILEVDEAPDSCQLIGGCTQMEWNWNLTVYAFEPDPYVDGNYGTGLLKIVDDLRQHFSNMPLINADLIDTIAKYNFTSTFKGVTKAQEIEKNNKIVVGRKINFASVAFDSVTQYTTTSTDNVESIIHA